MNYEVGKRASNGKIVEAIQILTADGYSDSNKNAYGEGKSFSSWDNQNYVLNTTTMKIGVWINVKHPILARCEWGPERQYVDYIFYDFTRRPLTEEEEDILKEWADRCRHWYSSEGVTIGDIEDFFGEFAYLAGIETSVRGSYMGKVVYEFDKPSNRTMWRIRILFDQVI